MDKNLKEILSGREEKGPSDGLEDKIMQEIIAVAKAERLSSRYLSLAWSFLFIGFASIVIISLVGIKPTALFSEFALFNFKSLIYIICITILLLLFENLYRKNLELKN